MSACTAFTDAGSSIGRVNRRRFPGCTRPAPTIWLKSAGDSVCDQLPFDRRIVASLSSAWTRLGFSTVIVGSRLPVFSTATAVPTSFICGVPLNGATLTSTPRLMMTCTVDWLLRFFKGICDSDSRKLWLSGKSGAPTHSTRNTWVTPGGTIACGGDILDTAPARCRLFPPSSSRPLGFLVGLLGHGGLLALVTFPFARAGGHAAGIS